MRGAWPESGCRVVVPLLINRAEKMSKLSNREYPVSEPHFEMGRHLIGYEVQQSLAVVDWFSRRWEDTPIGIVGWGEGGLIALYAAAVDTRIDVACVSGYFDSRQNIWQEPIDRNVFGLLEQFGDAELASLIAPRALIVDAARGPEATIPGGRGAPARVVSPTLGSVRAEVARAQKLTAALKPNHGIRLVAADEPLGGRAIGQFLDSLKPGAAIGQASDSNIVDRRNGFSVAKRHAKQVHELDRHTQWVLRESPYVRKQFYKPDTSSVAKFEASNEKYRRQFYEDADRPVRQRSAAVQRAQPKKSRVGKVGGARGRARCFSGCHRVRDFAFAP